MTAAHPNSSPNSRLASRLTIDPASQQPSLHSFGALSDFLRAAVADEELLQMGESMRAMASHIEAIVGYLSTKSNPVARTEMLMDLLAALRQHRALVVELGPVWRRLYEYAAHFTSLNNFRVLVGQWVVDPVDASEMPLRPLSRTDFELVAWRMLGDGAMLIDKYEQRRGQQSASEEFESELEPPDASLVARARAWWERLGR